MSSSIIEVPGNWTFFLDHRAEIFSATLDHLTLVVIAMAIAILIGVPLGMFIVQFPITSTEGRVLLSAVYVAITVAALIVNRRQLVPTLLAPFAGRAKLHGGHPHQPAEPAPAS